MMSERYDLAMYNLYNLKTLGYQDLFIETKLIESYIKLYQHIENNNRGKYIMLSNIEFSDSFNDFSDFLYAIDQTDVELFLKRIITNSQKCESDIQYKTAVNNAQQLIN